jgi:agmatine deiminase
MKRASSLADLDLGARMFKPAAIFFLALATNVAAAPTARLPDAQFLAAIQDDTAHALPRSLTPAERALMQSRVMPRIPLAPPPGAVFTPPEYAPNEGLIISWVNQFTALLTSMTVAITSGDPDAKVFVAVTAAREASARTTLTNAGADMRRVKFITASTDSVWMRDYGPRFVVHNGRRAMVDHVYNRPRPNDDRFPEVWQALTGEERYLLPLSHGGGNFHLFGNREAYMTSLIVNENPGSTAQQVRDLYTSYQGQLLDIRDPFPANFDSTQHIDMWLLPLSDRKVLVSQYDQAAAPIPHQVSEAAVSDLSRRGYEVFRTPGWQSGATHFTYANAVLINRLALVCQFNNQATRNAQALSTFQTALPNHQIVPLDCSSIIGAAGAMHCIVMHVPDVLFRDGSDSL